MNARANDVAFADDAQRGQSLRAAPGSAIRFETPEQFRTRTKHQWRKHQQAGANMMRWMWPRNAKQRRRQRKWMRDYERTLHSITRPNIPENTH